MDNTTLEALKNCPNDDANFSYFGKLFPLIYGIPTIIINIFIIHAILTTKSLKHAFFYQFIVFSTGNSLYWLVALMMDKILTLPALCPLFVEWFTKPSILLKSIYFVYCYSIENYFFCTFAIFSWRVLSILCYSATTLANGKNLRIMLVIQFLMPFSMFWAFINTTVYYGFTIPGSPRIVFLYHGWPYIDASFFSGIMFGFLFFIIFWSAILLVYRIIQIRQREDSRAERNIIVTCLTFGISAAAISLYQSAVFYFVTIAPNPIIFNRILSYRGFIIDVAALLPTWCLLLTSTKMRNKLFKPSSQQSQVLFNSTNSRHSR